MTPPAPAPRSLKPAPDGRRLVVHVVRQFWPNRGGLEDVVLNLCRRAGDAGYRIRVVTLNSLFSDPARSLPEREMLGDIEIVRIPWRGSSRYPVAPSVLDHIRDADLVHVHAIDFFFDFLALTKVLHRKPMIATTHGGFFHTRKFAALKSFWFKTLTRFSASRYAALVGCSTSDVSQFATIAPDVRLIENGVDLDKFADKAAREPRKAIVTIGRFSINKRLDRLIHMLTALRRHDAAWTLDIVGVESDLSATDLAALAREAGAETGVRIHVGLPEQDVARVISQCALFASASEYEGFGLVAIEAMSAGLTPVLQPNAAYSTLAGHHAAIRLCDFSDAETAASVLEQTYTAAKCEPGLRNALMDAAQTYSWSSSAAKYLAEYDAAILRRGAAR
ncbi:glycosyltransferase family 4 protein [Rhizobium sp. FKL33]|uniref:glycosyltransferase family 4 protein n=1 Tax=Rhizobium sp. FKL33 TaxID=2562307 RepID=UPI0010BFCE7E|nr:glycosyltransferase family 4 protein [Rhizobium sp. FKL33]